jgi:hypothetical protein
MATLRARHQQVDANGNSSKLPSLSEAASSPPTGKTEAKGGRDDKKTAPASDKTVHVIFFGLVLDLLGK